MKDKYKNLLKLFNAWTLLGCFVLFTILSWILLFRDKRALEGMGDFYPQLHSWLFTTRELLLQNNLNTIPTFLFGFIAAVAILAYLRSLALKISLKKTILFGLTFQFIAFFSYPILSTDIFSYMLSERVATVHNENIWKVIPANFPDDPYFPLADWKETTSVYGGVHYLAYYLPAKIAGDNLWLSIFLYKLIPTIFSLATVYVLYLLLKLKHSHFVEKGMRLVLWNPLYVLEIVGAGHNESLMIFFTLLSLFFFWRNLWLYAGIAIALAVQVKIIPLIFFVLLGFALFQKRQLKSLLVFVLAFAVTNALYFVFMQLSPIAYLQRVTYNGGVYWQSLPNLVRYYFEGVNTVITIIFGAWSVYFVLKQWKKQIDPVRTYGTILVVYLLFAISAYWNWYVLWVLCILPFITDKKIFWTVLVFSFTSLLAYPLLWLSLRFGFGSMIWPVITYLFVFGIPLFVYLFLQYREKTGSLLLKRFGLHEIIAEKPLN